MPERPPKAGIDMVADLLTAVVVVGMVVAAVAVAVTGGGATWILVAVAVVGGVAVLKVLSQPSGVTLRPTPEQVQELRAAGTGYLPPPRPSAPTGTAWPDARRRFAAVASRYAAYECDALAVLRLPALADVSVASTARFVDAFAEAQALATDDIPDATHAARFAECVSAVERAWAAAHDAAERIRHSTLDDGERRSVDRAIKLLTTARDSDSEPERLAAYSLAQAELRRLDRSGAVRMPLAARTAVAVSARRSIAPGAAADQATQP